jgi:hypothetical protein
MPELYLQFGGGLAILVACSSERQRSSTFLSFIQGSNKKGNKPLAEKCFHKMFWMIVLPPRTSIMMQKAVLFCCVSFR